MAFDSPHFSNRSQILSRFKAVRENSLRLAAPLSPEDWMLQSMEEASPVKWNLAHTSWFFESFLLKACKSEYEPYHSEFGYLFNSYYNQLGEMHPRPQRGLISRPSADDVLSYRAYVDAAMGQLISKSDEDALADAAPLIALGLAHEEQHQELLLTDIKHAFFQNSLLPAAYENSQTEQKTEAASMAFVELEGGLCDIGAGGDGFAFDNEGPRHKVWLEPFSLADRLVTNGEFMEFIADGAYSEPSLWLADAWALIQEEGWTAPLYWRRDGDAWRRFSLFGEEEIDPGAPVTHVSQYEAAAYAYWRGARLPTEFEWEAAATLFAGTGRFCKAGAPCEPAPAARGEKIAQLFGDCWEWTASSYVAYPKYATPDGAVGEYNGKFMSGQMVLRGGSCATPEGHVRSSYRNFFPPHARWQFSGLRLARDV